MDLSLRNKRIKVLEETISSYNINTRSKDKNGICVYINEQGLGCAVGRLIKDKELCSKLNDMGGISIIRSLHPIQYASIPKEVLELGYSFLMMIQSLHDTDKFWNSDGLSDMGKGYATAIRSCIDFGIFEDDF